MIDELNISEFGHRSGPERSGRTGFYDDAFCRAGALGEFEAASQKDGLLEGDPVEMPDEPHQIGSGESDKEGMVDIPVDGGH